MNAPAPATLPALPESSDCDDSLGHHSKGSLPPATYCRRPLLGVVPGWCPTPAQPYYTDDSAQETR